MSIDVAELARQGYLVVDGLPSPDALDVLLSELGDVVLRTSVELRPRVTTYLCQPRAVPMHSDHPDIDLIAWWCERQDEEDGATLLVDAVAVVDQISESVRRELQTTLLPCPELRSVGNTDALAARSVLSLRGVYFAPWLHPNLNDNSDAWSELARAVKGANPIEVRLTPGQALVIDNRRMLHGRRGVIPGSRRLLHRSWVQLSSGKS